MILALVVLIVFKCFPRAKMQKVGNNPPDKEDVGEVTSNRIRRSVELWCFLFSASLSDLILSRRFFERVVNWFVAFQMKTITIFNTFWQDHFVIFEFLAAPYFKYIFSSLQCCLLEKNYFARRWSVSIIQDARFLCLNK